MTDRQLPAGCIECPDCRGDGFIGWSWGQKDTCGRCRGEGYVRADAPAPDLPAPVIHQAHLPQPSIEIWVCRYCGRTVTAPAMRCYDPQTRCFCQKGEHNVIIQMEKV